MTNVNRKRQAARGEPPRRAVLRSDGPVYLARWSVAWATCQAHRSGVVGRQPSIEAAWPATWPSAKPSSQSLVCRWNVRTTNLALWVL